MPRPPGGFDINVHNVAANAAGALADESTHHPAVACEHLNCAVRATAAAACVKLPAPSAPQRTPPGSPARAPRYLIGTNRFTLKLRTGMVQYSGVPANRVPPATS